MMKKLAIIIIFLSVIAESFAEDGPARVYTYPLPAIYKASAVFSLQVAGVPIAVTGYNDKYDYAHFSMSKGRVEVVITLLNNAAVSAYAISPKKLAIPGRAENNQLRFTLYKDAYLIIKINELKELIITADPEEENKPAPSGKGIFNITGMAYAADASGKTMCTNALQKAINDASAWHNGIVYVPAGVYKVGNINLKSNVSLYLEGGTVLLFSGRAEDYSVKARKASQNRNLTWWFYTDSGAHNIKLYGRGMLDGNGKYATETGGIGNNILAVFHTQHFTMDGPIIRESGTWAVIPVRSKHLVFRNFKLFNRFDMGENDGIDVMECEDVLVQHGIGVALDDPFSTKTWEQNTDLCRNWPGHPLPQKNIVFNDLLSWTYCYAYKVGQGVMQPQTHITFKNCVVYDAAVGIGIHHKWGTSYVSHVLFDNIEIESLSYQNDDNRVWGVFFMQNGDKKGSGPISDIRVQHITIHDPGRSPGKIKGIGETRSVSNVIFKNIVLPGPGKPAANLQEMQMTDTMHCRNIRVIPSAATTPRAIGRLVANRFVNTPHTNFGFKTPPSSITYSEVCAWYGALKFAEAANDHSLQERLYQRILPLLNEKKELVPLADHVDHTVFGAIPFELYKIKKDTVLFNMGKRFADQQWHLPVNAKPEHVELHKQGFTWQTRFWIDDMYMINLIQSKAFCMTGDTVYINRAAREMIEYLKRLQQPNGLFYHAPDVPFFWGRGNGWMAAGMTEILLSLPANSIYRPAILKGYKTMMGSLLRFQSADGMWRQLIDDSTAWPETSCTGMFTYAMITGVKKGWINKKLYKPAAYKAWQALITYINPDGDVRGICEGTNKKNDRRFYLDRQRITGDMHGQAPVLWCAAAFLLK